MYGPGRKQQRTQQWSFRFGDLSRRSTCSVNGFGGAVGASDSSVPSRIRRSRSSSSSRRLARHVATPSPRRTGAPSIYNSLIDAVDGRRHFAPRLASREERGRAEYDGYPSELGGSRRANLRAAVGLYTCRNCIIPDVRTSGYCVTVDAATPQIAPTYRCTDRRRGWYYRRPLY